MNQNLILRIVGVILCIEALCMIPPLLLSVFGGGVDQRAFLYALLICGGVGVLLSLIRADNARLQTRDGFVCVALCWIALSVFGALPYFFSGSCSFIDAIFETVSGLTTTGAPTTGFSVPVMASTMAMKLSVSENVILSLMVRIMRLESAMRCGSSVTSSSTSAISAASTAMSLPTPPIAMPTSAA